MALMRTKLEEAHRAEVFLALHAVVELFRIVLWTQLSFVSLCLLNEFFDRATAHKVLQSDLRATGGTPRVVLHVLEEILQAHQALDGRAVWTHPYFTLNDFKADDALAEGVHRVVAVRHRRHLLLLHRYTFYHLIKKHI